MGICTNQFDLIDNRFFNQRIKTLKVVSSTKAQAADSVVALDVLAAALIDPLTGLLLANRQLVATILNVQGSVTVDKVFDTYTIQLIVIDTLVGIPIPTAVQTVTVSGFTDTPGTLPTDCLQKHDIQLAPVTFTVGPLAPFVVTINLSVEACIIVARETILKVNSAEVFCP